MRAKESMKVREEQLEEEVRRRVKGIVAESQARIRKMEIECETRLHTLKAQYQSRLSLIEGEYEERLKTMPARQATNSSAKLTTENSLRAILLYTSFKATYSRYTRSMEEFLHSIDLLQRVLLQKMLLPISSFDAFVGTGVKLSPITGVVHSESSKPVLHVVKWSEEEEGYFCREVVKPDNLMGLGEERSWKVDVSWDREVVLVI
ncbi:hypothetical protein B7494_g3725 [Chlorociboria aeruginascens]|nr:hypothetical protein B7494_g3725 [Chlorociboria aeruginascens]